MAEGPLRATRRSVIAGAGALALGPFAAASGAEPMTFTTPFGFDPTFIDVMNAVSGGHFARAGLDAKLIGPPGNAQAFQLVVAGSAQFSYIASIDFIRAVATRGAPFYAIACLSHRVGFQIMSLPEKPVRSGADLRGKTVGVLSIGGLSELLVDVVRAKAGVPKSEVEVVVAGSNPGEVELVRNGRLDCFIGNLPLAVTLRRMGQPLIYLAVDDVLPAPGQLFFCTRETAEKRPEYVRAFLRAIKASVVEIITGPVGPIFERAARDFEIPRIKDLDTLVAVQAEVIRHQWLAEGKENLLRSVPRLWQSAADGLRDIGVADVKDVSALYTNAFIDEVMSG